MLSESEVLSQEIESTLPYFNLSLVDKLVNEIKKSTSSENFENICILISLNRRKVYFRSGKNTSSENNMWINKKLNTVEAFDHSTFYKKAVYAGNEAKFYQDTGFSPKEFTIGGGGFPIFVKDVGTVGSLIISGLTDFEDHQLAYDSLISLKKEL